MHDPDPGPSKAKIVASAAFFGLLTLMFLVGGLALVSTPGDRWGGAALLTLSVLTGGLCALWISLIRNVPTLGRRIVTTTFILIALVGTFGALGGAKFLWGLTAVGIGGAIWTEKSSR